MLDLLDKKYSSDSEIYFNRTTLIQSKESRNVELLTISSSSKRSLDRI